MVKQDKIDMLAEGKDLAARLIATNDMLPVNYRLERLAPGIGCGYYDPRGRCIVIDPARCAARGTGGWSWSWPGYKVDRTPFGVVLHELGHHWHLTCCEDSLGVVRAFRAACRDEEPVTSYAPNTGEDIAESFRLFAANPTLLKAIRPLRHAFLARLMTPVEDRGWEEILDDSERHVLAAERQVQCVRG